MLHRIAFIALLLSGSVAGAAPGEGAPLRDPVRVAEREALRVGIRAVTVVVRRRGALPKGMWSPGGGVSEGHGWWAGAGRVVTAAVVGQGWPVGPADVIEVELADGARYPAAVGVSEAALGLMVLDVPGLPPPPRVMEAAVSDPDVSPGRPLYAADGSGLLHRMVVGRAGDGQHAYYWRLGGWLAPGTPLFDGRGRITSMVGRMGDGEALALPAKALRALLERDDWR
ncbi:MAG: hypothetical protein R3F65_22460 [bacterium]|nr:hypothetical protein [Myxococcales bacterium]MCB9542631.1 hypothetical protein [Myxococcales bacterium]